MNVRLQGGSSWLAALVAASSVFATPSVVAAQPERVATLDGRVVGDWWRLAPADPDSLRSLVRATEGRAGPAALRVLLATLTDPDRPPVIRLYALIGVNAYINPGFLGLGSGVCGEDAVLDTLQVPGERVTCGRSSHPNYYPSSSIEPALRDSIRIALRSVADRGGGVGRSTEYVLSRGTDGAERWDSRTALRCGHLGRAAAAALEMDAVAAILSSDFSALARCSENGPPALLMAWRVAPDSDSLLAKLARESAAVRDRRVFDVLLEVSFDRTRPKSVRLAAVSALAPHLHPRLYLYGRNMSALFDPRTCMFRGWHLDHAVQEVGPWPLGANARREGIAALRGLASRERDETLRSEARLVAECAERFLNVSPSPASFPPT